MNKKTPGLSCGGVCGQCFHGNGMCCDVSKSQLTLIKRTPGVGWRCTQCRLLPTTAFDLNGTLRSTGSPPITQPMRSSGAAAVGSRIEDGIINRSTVQDGLPESVTQLTGEIRSLQASVEFCSQKISDFELKLAKFTEVLARMAKLERENNALKLEVDDLNLRLDSVEQHNRSNNFEIQNVPEKSGENILTIVEIIGKSINMPIDANSIDHVTRVPTKIKTSPKNIIVRFSSKIKRDCFLSAYKAKRIESGEVRAGMEVKELSCRLYINEHLTTKNKILFREARVAAKEKQYKFVWIQNGNILVRKDDKSKILHIVDHNSLQKM